MITITQNNQNINLFEEYILALFVACIVISMAELKFRVSCPNDIYLLPSLVSSREITFDRIPILFSCTNLIL